MNTTSLPRLVVIGSSMGGVEALRELLAQLPSDFPCSLMVVQHTSPHRASNLAAVLSRVCAMPVQEAADRQAFLPGHVYLAPPNLHLLVQGDLLRTGHGPRENRSRPAIDPLFRSAAFYHRERVIGLILTGLLDDGASGLRAVKRCGGMALVQDPDDATHPGMPNSALAATSVDGVASLADLPALLERCLHTLHTAPGSIPDTIRKEVQLTERAMSVADHSLDMQVSGELGPLVPFTCPECGGSLWQISKEDRYRCHVGHAYTLHSLREEQDQQLEESLWAAVRALEERQKTYLALREQESARGNSPMRERYEETAAESARHANRVREVLLGLTTAEEL